MKHLATILAATLVAACAPTEESPEETDTDVEDTDVGDTDTDTDVPTVRITATVSRLDDSSRAVGASVCFVVDGEDFDCKQVKESITQVLIQAPANTQGAVRFKDGGLATFYWMMHTGRQNINLAVSIDTPAIVDGYYEQTTITRDPSKVTVLGELYPDALEGYQMQLSPTSGDGPYYYETFNGSLDTTATSTLLPTAMGVMLNVDPAAGPYSLSFTKDATTCTDTAYGKPLSTFDLPEDADIVYASIGCP